MPGKILGLSKYSVSRQLPLMRQGIGWLSIINSLWQECEQRIILQHGDSYMALAMRSTWFYCRNYR